MGIRNYFKKLGRRAAGTWGRVNHPRDMRAANKSIRKSLVDKGYETMEIPGTTDLNGFLQALSDLPLDHDVRMLTNKGFIPIADVDSATLKPRVGLDVMCTEGYHCSLCDAGPFDLYKDFETHLTNCPNLKGDSNEDSKS
jgi:hypothetical protein